MGKCFLHGNGGGVALNFKLIGGETQPSTAAENRIWVNTGVDISGYLMSPVEPEEPAEGFVWIRTGTSGVALSAVKSGQIHLYLVACAQYVSGAWVARDAYLYQSGTWTQFAQAIVYLFNNGDQCTDLTGGWTSDGYSYEKRDVDAPTIGTTIKVATTTHTTEHASFAGTANSIDLTDVDTVYIKVTDVTNSAGFHALSGKAIASNSVASVSITAAGTYALDVSGLSGSYYLALNSISSTAQPVRGATVSEVWEE